MPDAPATDQMPWEQYASQKPWELYATPKADAAAPQDLIPDLNSGDPYKTASAALGLAGIQTGMIGAGIDAQKKMQQDDIEAAQDRAEASDDDEGGDAMDVVNTASTGVNNLLSDATGYVGNVARGVVTDATLAYSNPTAQNTRAALRGDQLPQDVILSQISKSNPVAATAGKVAQGVLQTAPLLAAGGLPALGQKLVALGFSAQMIKDAPDLARQLGEQLGLPPDQRDPDKVTSLISQAIQTGVFAPLAGAHGISGLKGGESDASSISTPAEVHGAMRTQPVSGQGEVPAQEGGAGVQPQPAEAPQAQVPLTQPDHLNPFDSGTPGEQFDYSPANLAKYKQLTADMKNLVKSAPTDPAALDKMMSTAGQIEELKNRYNGGTPKNLESPGTGTPDGGTKNAAGAEVRTQPQSGVHLQHDEETGEWHVVNGKDEVVSSHATMDEAAKAATPDAGLPKQEPFLEPTDQKAFDYEIKKVGTPIEYAEPDDPNNPYQADQVATINRKTGSIVINPRILKWHLDNIPKSQRAMAIRSILAEEQIHLHTDDAAAHTYWKNLSPWEQAIAKRTYSGGREIAGMDDTLWGHEALRIRIQQLARMKTSEMAAVAGREKWTLKGLSILEHAIRGARSALSFKAGRESRAILRRVQRNISAARAVLKGSEPKSGARLPEPKEPDQSFREAMANAFIKSSRGAPEPGTPEHTMLNADAIAQGWTPEDDDHFENALFNFATQDASKWPMSSKNKAALLDYFDKNKGTRHDRIRLIDQNLDATAHIIEQTHNELKEIDEVWKPFIDDPKAIVGSGVHEGINKEKQRLENDLNGLLESQNKARITKAKLENRPAPRALFRGRPKKQSESKEQQDFILPGMESTRLAGSKIAASNVPGQEGAELPQTPEDVKAADEAKIAATVPQRPTSAELGKIGEKALSDDVAARVEQAKTGQNTRLPNLKDFAADLKKRWSGLRPGEVSDIWSGTVGKFLGNAKGEDLRLLGKAAFGGNVREILSDKEINEKFPGDAKAATEYAKQQEKTLAREGKKKGGSIWNAPVPDANEGADIKVKYTALERDLEKKLGELEERKAEAKDLKDEVDNYAGGDLKLPELEARLKDARTDVWDATKFAQDARRRIKELEPEYQGVIQKQKRRAWISSAIFRKMVKPTEGDSDAMLNRKSITPDDVRPSNDGKYSSYEDVSDFPKSRLGEALVDKARRSSKDSATITRRLALVENKRTGEVSLVSVYDRPHGPEVENDPYLVDPLSPTRTHVPLDDFAGKYNILRSVFLDQPVRKFVQHFKDYDEYRDKLGKQLEMDVANAAGHSTEAISEAEFAQEAGGRISEGSGGSFQGPHRDLVAEPESGAAERAEVTPITPQEERSLVDYVNQFGRPRNPEDVMRALEEMAIKKPSATVVSALRKISAGFQKHFPDYDTPAILKALSRAIYDKTIPTGRALPEAESAKAAGAGKNVGTSAQAAGEQAGDQAESAVRSTTRPEDVISSAAARNHDFKTGEPVTVQAYHGSRNAVFSKFSMGKFTWFTSDPEYASGRAEESEIYQGPEGNPIEGPARSPAVYPVTVTMKNPLVTNERYPFSDIKSGGHDGAVIGKPGEPKFYIPLPEKGAEVKSQIGGESMVRKPSPGESPKSPRALFRRQLNDKRDETMEKLGVVKSQVRNLFKRLPTGKHMAATLDGAHTIGNNMGAQAEMSIRLESADNDKNALGFAKNFRGKREILEAAPAVLASGAVKTLYHYDAKALAEKARLLREDEHFVSRAHSLKSMLGRASSEEIKSAQKMLGTDLQNKLIETGFLKHDNARYLFDTSAKEMLDKFMADVKLGTEQAKTMAARGNVWDKYRGRRWIKSNEKIMRTLEYAKAQWEHPELRNTAVRAKMEADRQFDTERDNGYSLHYDPEYLPGRYEGSVWSPNGIIFGGQKIMGRQYYAGKTFKNIYEAAKVGPYIPASLDIASLMGSRVRTGMNSVSQRMWWNSLKELKDENGNFVVKEGKPGGGAPSPDYVEFPLKGTMQKVYVHQSYEGLIHQLTDPDATMHNAASKLLLETTQYLKHTALLGDVFHLGRVAYYSQSIMGFKGAKFIPGWAATVIREADLDRAVDRGIIAPQTRDYLKEKIAFRIGEKADMISRSRLSELYERSGLNTGRIQDALYKDLVKNFPILGTYNRFLFDRFTTGMMKTGALKEFDRLSKKDPQKDSRQIVQESAKDLNLYYGSIGRQGWIKSATFRSIANMGILAPQWLEGLVKKELQPLKLLTNPYAALTGRTTAFRGIARGFGAMMVLTQVANMITRGTPTWSNPEKDHKWDAWIPGNVWLSPLSVFNELTADIVRISETKQRKWDAIQQVGMNKLSFAGRFATVLASGSSPTGEYQSTTAGVLKTAAEQLIPIPISVGTWAQFGAHFLAPGTVPPVPLQQLMQKTFATMGIKTHAGLDPVQTMNIAAQAFRQANGVEEPKIEFTDEATNSKLRYQLKNGDEGGAARTFQQLRRHHTDGEIIQSMETWARRPFTSQVQEGMFQAGMDDYGRKVYNQAIQQRYDQVNQFLEWYDKQAGQAR